MRTTLIICVAISLAGSILGGLIAGAVLLWLNAAHGDWLGFAGGVTGGVIGGAMTIGAGYLAWRGVREQNELTRTMLRDRADESAMRLRLSIRRTKDFIKEARGHLAVIIHRPSDGRTVLAYGFHVIQARYAALAAIDQADPRLRDLLADEMSDVRVSCVRLPAVQTTVELAEAGPIEHEIAVLDGALDRLSAALHQATTPVALNMLRTHSAASA